MRTFNSLKNIFGNFLNSFILNLLRFISRIVFVKVLDEVYLGVNGLLSNVLGLLALAELGIGTAISYSLYKPLADKDIQKCQSLMNFYKKAYRVIALIVFVLGIALLPFLPLFIKDTSGIENLSLIYLIFLGNMVITYLFSYKRTLITADQKNYKITPFLIFFNFLTTVSQIVILLLFKNYILYLITQTICIVLENITINKFIDKNYSYLKEIKKAKPIESEELSNIKTNIKALMLHKVGTYVLTATDNIVISKFIGIVTVGIYSNYVLIYSSISNFIYMFVSNITASFGNLLVNEPIEKCKKVFFEMNFLTFCMYGVSAVCLIFIFNPFIELVFGKTFVLPFAVVVMIMINYYMAGINQVPITVQAAAGIYKYDKFVPLLEAFVNLFVSIILVQKIGIIGVLIGTFVSYLLPLIIKPFIVFKYVFKDRIYVYFKVFFKQLFALMLSIVIIFLVLNFLNIESLILQVIVNTVISLTIFILIIMLMYKNTTEFSLVTERMKFIIKKNKKVVIK